MKPFMIALGCVIVMGVAVTYYDSVESIVDNTAEVYKEDEEVLEENVEQAPVDPIQQAKEQLDEANRLLDEEEVRLLKEIEEREARLEQIRETRTSF